ncbi:MAG: iron-containing alcohol dehydrogenase, partial [Desulfobacterales bacterium]|nr:iron-containing alcohol dehydrogenase [Desulfobacterales bacterium]
SIIEAHKYINMFGKRKAILITDQANMKSKAANAFLNSLMDTHTKVLCTFDEIPEFTTLKTVTECAALGKKNKCNLIIAMGGENVMDTAKVANLMMCKGGKLRDYIGLYCLNEDEILLPSFFIPTSCGNGAFINKLAMITDTDRGIKLPLLENQFLPQFICLDSDIAISASAKTIAIQALDAITHAIEAYITPKPSPIADAMALQAIQLLTQHILQVCKYPENTEARNNILTGCLLAGVASSSSTTGMVHAISYALENIYQIPHGLTNPLILPEVMLYNLDSRIDRLANIAHALGIGFPEIIHESQKLMNLTSLQGLASGKLKLVSTWLETQTSKMKRIASKAIENFGFIDQWGKHQSAKVCIEKMKHLILQVAFLTGIPLNLKDAGMNDTFSKIDKVTKSAMDSVFMLYNPVQPSQGAVTRMIKRAYHSSQTPISVSPTDILCSPTPTESYPKEIFKTSEMIYDVFVPFFRFIKNEAEIGQALKRARVCVQFQFNHPDAIVTIDSRLAREIVVHQGKYEEVPDIIFIMDADIAHLFWHGLYPIVEAISNRKIQIKGNVLQMTTVMSIIEQAFELFPRFLQRRGSGNLVISNKNTHNRTRHV